jgi:hypothetical protein
MRDQGQRIDNTFHNMAGGAFILGLPRLKTLGYGEPVAQKGGDAAI